MAKNHKYYANERWAAGMSAYTGGLGWSFSGSSGTQLYIYAYTSSSYNKYYTMIWECLPNTTYRLTVTGDYHNNSTWLVKTMTATTSGSTLYDVIGLTKTYDSGTGLTTYQFTTGANANYVGLGNKNSVSSAESNYPETPRLLSKQLPPDWYNLNLLKYQTEEYVDFPFNSLNQGWSIGGTGSAGTLSIYNSTDYNYSRTAVLVYSVPQRLTSKNFFVTKVTLNGDLSNDFDDSSATTWIIKYATDVTLTNGCALKRISPNTISYDSSTNETTFYINVPTNATYILIGNRVSSTSAYSDLHDMWAKIQFYYEEGWHRGTNFIHKRTSGAWD